MKINNKVPRKIIERDDKNKIKKTIKVKDKIYKCLYIDDDIKEAVDNIKENESLHILSTGQVTIIELIKNYVKLYKIVDNISIATLSYYYEGLMEILELFDNGCVKDIEFIRCTMFIKDKDKLFLLTDQEFQKRNLKTKGINNHAKIYLIKSGDNYIVITGSQNLTKNPLTEQFIIYNNKILYTFYKQWFDLVFEEDLNG